MCLRWRACAAVLAASCAACPAGPAGKQDKAKPRLSTEDRELLEKLRRLHRAGRDKELLGLTVGRKLSGKDFGFQREVLHLQSESFRRTGQFQAARSAVTQWMKSAQKLPEFRRKDEVAGALFLVAIYRGLRRGQYVSPRGKPERPAKDGPPAEPVPITDDAGWAAAKRDYAIHSFELMERRFGKLKKATDLWLLVKEVSRMLGGAAVVHAHVPTVAAERGARLAAAEVKRFDEVLAAKNSLPRAEKLCNGTLWQEVRLLRLDHKVRTAEKITEQVRQLYLINYQLGKMLTEFARPRDLIGRMSEALSTVSGRRADLQDRYAEVERYVDRKYRIHRLGAAPSDPLKKIPTGKW